MQKTETICAISTAPGVGAVAMIRLSGSDSFEIANKVTTYPGIKRTVINQDANTVHFARILSKQSILDEVMVSKFTGPHSYTGEDTIEFTCHGSAFIQQKILEILIGAGARLAKPGEFTLRAFLNGKLDLSQAEGVADLIATSFRSRTQIGHKPNAGWFFRRDTEVAGSIIEFYIPD
jgi:tRNA modification GTPase